MNVNKISIFLVLLIALSSCSTRKYLNPGDVLLKSNKIEVLGDKPIESKIRISEQLSILYRQKPNRNWLLLIPREYLHYYVQTRKNKDSWFIKSLAKPSETPALLDTALCNLTQQNITNYLYNQGYFYARCAYNISIKRQYATVTYLVNPGEQFYINDIQFSADDKSIEELINQHQDASFLVLGEPLDFSVFQKEKARISELIFNNGYAEFNPIYIQTLDVDTFGLKCNVRLHISNPEGRSDHPRYTVNRIVVDPFYFPGDTLDSIEQEYDSIKFKVLPYYQFVKPKVLASKISFRPGMIAGKYLIDESYSQLNRLGIYRFVNIEAKIDTLDKLKINYNIQCSPMKKWVFDFGADFNYTSVKALSQTLFGISGFVNLKNRNLFKRAESFSTKLEVGTELPLFDFKRYNSLSVHYSNELSLPSFYDITGSWGIAKNSWKLITKLSADPKPLPNKPDSRTNMRIGIDYEKLDSLYSYISLNANIEYDWWIKRRKRISLHTLGFSLYLPETEEKFDTLLKDNPFLANSFKGRRLFTSYFLDNLTFYYQSRVLNNKQHLFIGNLNLSGIEVHAANKIYNALASKKDTFSLGEFEFSKFIKTEIDYRFHYAFSDKSKLASRIAFGIATPFGASNTVPYIKQFYSGGPQSLRAWNIRELGPGAKLPDKSLSRPIYYSSGDIKLEANVEYRFDIVWRFKGAIFLDAGNIWLLPDEGLTKQQGAFSETFYEDLAIGTGLGLRIDMSYFLFRVDVGFRLRNPYEENGSHWIFSEKNPVSVKNLFNNSTLHLALDYPF